MNLPSSEKQPIQKNVPKKPAKRTPPRLLQVVRTQRLSDAMQRITLSGDALHGFPTDRNGAHIKIFLPQPGQDKPVLPTLGENGPVWPPAHLRPITRTYSVRRYYPDTNELDVDFVMHGSKSPASGWALNAAPGDYLGVAGPGGPDPLLSPADQHIIAGDLTALPAISALLEELPEHAQGHVFIEIDRSEHRQAVANNTRMAIHWVLREPDIPPQSAGGTLLQAVKNAPLPLPEQSLSAFVAGENGLVLSVRDYLRQTYGLRKNQLYAVPYWRRGQDEETYHQERHRIMDQVY
jgi:NADPH-dependent ferric siderophore reductase